MARMFRTHVQRCHWSDSRQDEDDGHEQGPQTSVGIYVVTPLAHVPRTRLELAKDDLAEDRDTVTPVQRDGTNVKDTGNSGVGSETDQVDSNTAEHGEPNCQDRCTSKRQNFGPEPGPRDEPIAGESKDCSRQGLHGGEADELDDDEGTDGVEDSSTLAKDVVEDLSHWLIDRAGEDRCWVAHAEAQDNVEKEAGNIGKQHCHRDGPWSLDFRLRDPEEQSQQAVHEAAFHELTPL